MPLRRDNILRVCEILAEQEELRVTTNESFKGACFAFTGALVGGILGGPIGLGIGSAAGGVYAAYRSKDKFKSAVTIMQEMPYLEKQRLAEAVNAVLHGIDASDVITLMALLNSNQLLRENVLELIKKSLTQNMGLTLV